MHLIGIISPLRTGRSVWKCHVIDVMPQQQDVQTCSRETQQRPRSLQSGLYSSDSCIRSACLSLGPFAFLSLLEILNSRDDWFPSWVSGLPAFCNTSVRNALFLAATLFSFTSLHLVGPNKEPWGYKSVVENPVSLFASPGGFRKGWTFGRPTKRFLKMPSS